MDVRVFGCHLAPLLGAAAAALGVGAAGAGAGAWAGAGVGSLPSEGAGPVGLARGFGVHFDGPEVAAAAGAAVDAGGAAAAAGVAAAAAGAAAGAAAAGSAIWPRRAFSCCSIASCSSRFVVAGTAAD